MRCSCRKCGTYMIQEEYGLESGCKCPACGEMCHDCMGSVQRPLDKESLAALFALGVLDETEFYKTEREPQRGDANTTEQTTDWSPANKSQAQNREK